MADHDTSELPASKHAYSFDDLTRELLGPVEVFLSPLEGTYFLPRNVVDIAPPVITEPHRRARLNDEGTAWEIVPDFRRVMLWDTATALPVANTLALGDTLPAGITAEAPPVVGAQAPLTNVWDREAQAWRQVPDYSRTPVWDKVSAQRVPSPAPGEPLPDTVTTLAPPHGDVHQAPRWNTARDQWERVADFRGVVYWTDDGVQHVIDQVGVEPPADARMSPPDALAPSPASPTP